MRPRDAMDLQALKRAAKAEFKRAELKLATGVRPNLGALLPRAVPESASFPTLAIASGADPIVNKKETALLVGVSLSTLDRMIARNDFPRPLQLSLRRVGWPLSLIQAWISSRSASAAEVF